MSGRSEAFKLRETISKRSKEYGKRMEVSHQSKMKSLIRRINVNRIWLGKILKELRNRTNEGSESYIDLEGDFININEKLMLLSRSESRKEPDLKKLAQKLSYMEPFYQYSQPIIKNLVKNSRIVGFEAGRRLFEAGHRPLGAYFILSGEVQVGPDDGSDPIQRFLEKIHKGQLHASLQKLKTSKHDRGTLLGMNEVLFGEPRHDRITVTKDILCIQFDKKFIMETLLPLINRWYDIFRYMTDFEIFEHFDFEATRELSTIGKIKNYRGGTLIDATDISCFLIEGQIIVIQRLLVENYFINGILKKRLYHDQDTSEYGENVDAIFMKVCVLNKGSYFGIDERLSKNKLWAANACRVLYFSKNTLLKYGSPELWSAIRARLDAFYPSDNEILKFFQYGRDWLKFKKVVSSQLKRGRGVSTIHDIPVTVRSEQMKLKRSFMKKVDMARMPDYLLGGTDPLDDEILNSFVLDEGGPLREYMFGLFKTDPNQAAESERKSTLYSRVPKYETFPSFYYFDALK